MLSFPSIDPVALSLGGLKIHWYGLMYLVAFAGAWLLAYWRNQHYHLQWTVDQISDLIFYSVNFLLSPGHYTGRTLRLHAVL
jgi:phosphatidylglycerol:prolipoprotein diacylglycerol transferase